MNFAHSFDYLQQLTNLDKFLRIYSMTILGNYKGSLVGNLWMLLHLYKGTNVQGTDVQGDFGPRRLMSKEAFTSDKLAQNIF